MYNRYFSSKGVRLRPRLVDGYYPEKSTRSASSLEKILRFLSGYVRNVEVDSKKIQKILTVIDSRGQKFKELDDKGLMQKTSELRSGIYRQGLTKDLTAAAFALIRETAGRTVGMRHYKSQLMGAWIMVHGGLAEMDTGEGKTLTATLAAATAAFAGIPVHVVTVNDYLVTRDATEMAPLYNALGLSVGGVTADMDEDTRRKGYSCDITYCTNKQLAFDYLRDRMLLGNDFGRLRLKLEKVHRSNGIVERLFLRGLCYAIVDEADSVLVDEARTPLIISRKADVSEEKQTYLEAIKFAEELDEGDFEIDSLERVVQLNEKGCDYLNSVAGKMGGVWAGKRRREDLVRQALAAIHLHHREYHYVVRDGKILIIDQNTGRLMADRSWERGLHQMIELKENCEMSGRNEPLARLTYQRFFRRYMCLAGMTGTAREVRRELWSVYGLPVSRVPPNKTPQRVDLGETFYPTKGQKWDAVVARISMLQEQGRPVLIGTRSVADSELLSELLSRIELKHQVLNAHQDFHEAQIVARAGERGCVTVATNMAGRGTDIPLGPGVAEIGGLHVISTERNEARRIDRQLYGRSGRQGDPGSCESILSLEDDLLQTITGRAILKKAIALLGEKEVMLKILGSIVTRHAQVKTERRHRCMRRDLMQMDEQHARMLAFSGRME